MKRTESTVTITENELIDAMAKALAIMTHEEPATILIADVLAEYSAITTKILFKED